MESLEIDDVIIADDVVATKRAKALAELDRIARTAKKAIVEAGIDLELFFTVPNSGNAILTYGTTSDVADEVWDGVQALVASVVQEIVDPERPHIREVSWALTGPFVDGEITAIAQIEPEGSL